MNTPDHICNQRDKALRKELIAEVKTMRAKPSITCPHCEYVFSESYDYSDSGETECPRCEKPFSFWRNVTYDTSTRIERK